jgi:glycosyltransferase involved in cell wall biosynthesis
VALSGSLKARLLEESVASPSKVLVMGHGSIGVDLNRFTPVDDARRRELREERELSPSTRVVTFVARLTRDKGIDDLPIVWTGVIERVPDAWLLVVGDPDPGESIDQLRGLTRTSFLGHTSEVEKVFQLADLNLSLSRREGLGMVPLEAAACGIPTAGYAVTGIVDSVEDGVAGRLVPLGDTARLIEEITRLLSTPKELDRLGAQAQGLVRQRFRMEDVWDLWRSFLEGRTPTG